MTTMPQLIFTQEEYVLEAIEEKERMKAKMILDETT